LVAAVQYGFLVVFRPLATTPPARVVYRQITPLCGVISVPAALEVKFREGLVISKFTSHFFRAVE
jgi:hypothetical protein